MVMMMMMITILIERCGMLIRVMKSYDDTDNEDDVSSSSSNDLWKW